MALELYFHPLSSYCHKALIALYENETSFEKVVVDLGDPTSRGAFEKVWPIAKFPVLRDTTRNETVPEACIVIEYLAQHYPGRTQLVPTDPDRARKARLRDRFFDHYVNDPMGKIVTDCLRPPGKNDTVGVEQARTLLRTALDMLERELPSSGYAIGDDFTMADCAAAPALFFTHRITPFASSHPRVMAYLERLQARPSFARVIDEAAPFLQLMPKP